MGGDEGAVGAVGASKGWAKLVLCRAERWTGGWQAGGEPQHVNRGVCKLATHLSGAEALSPSLRAASPTASRPRWP